MIHSQVHHPNMLHYQVYYLSLLHSQVHHPSMPHSQVYYPSMLHSQVYYLSMLHFQVYHPTMQHSQVYYLSMLHSHLYHPNMQHSQLYQPSMLHSRYTIQACFLLIYTMLCYAVFSGIPSCLEYAAFFLFTIQPGACCSLRFTNTSFIFLTIRKVLVSFSHIYGFVFIIFLKHRLSS